MRLLLVNSFYREDLPSGENAVVRNQVKLLQSSGVEVQLWSEQSKSDMSIKEQSVLGVETLLGIGKNPRDAIESFKPDLIHVHNTFPNISHSWIRSASVPILMTLHNYRAICANGVLVREGKRCMECVSMGPLRGILHGCYRNSRVASASVVGYQQHLRRAIRSSVDVLIYTSAASENLLKPLFPGVPSSLIPNYVPDVGLGTSNIHQSTEGYYLVLGRLTEEKGIGELLSIWPPGFRLVIAGEGPQREVLKLMAESLGVDFLGYVDLDKRNELLRGALGLILPSVTLEADPLVVSEALSAGTPCIVNSGTASAALSSTSPSVIPYESGGELRVALERLLHEDLKVSARWLYEETWSAGAWTSRYMSLVEEVLRGKTV